MIKANVGNGMCKMNVSGVFEDIVYDCLVIVNGVYKAFANNDEKLANCFVDIVKDAVNDGTAFVDLDKESAEDIRYQ